MLFAIIVVVHILHIHVHLCGLILGPRDSQALFKRLVWLPHSSLERAS